MLEIRDKHPSNNTKHDVEIGIIMGIKMML